MLKVGDGVRIINAEKIEGNEGYFKDGDKTTITTYKGHLALKHAAKELGGGLVLSPHEQQFIEKL